jgi:hypothetical protein
MVDDRIGHIVDSESGPAGAKREVEIFAKGIKVLIEQSHSLKHLGGEEHCCP